MILALGDCRERLAELAPDSVDACVCDPPYELGFMGKAWDSTGVAFDPETWRSVYRVLKPGAHLLAFGGTRTVHRIAVAIEDAGFEIRDQMLFWGYGQGFPKSLNVSEAAKKAGIACNCAGSALQYNHENLSRQDLRSMRQELDPEGSLPGGPQSDVQSGMYGETDRPAQRRAQVSAESANHGAVLGLREANRLSAESPGTHQDTDLFLRMQRQASSAGAGSARRQHEGAQAERPESGTIQPGLEGRGDVFQDPWELHGSAVRPVSGGIPADGAGGRLRDGAPADDGQAVRLPAPADRSGASPESRSGTEHRREPGTVADEWEPQGFRAWPHCSRCGLPILPDGLGTALKPAYEPIIVARKRLRGTVAANVATHGTGALNIDGCRIETGGEERKLGTNPAMKGNSYGAGKPQTEPRGEPRVTTEGRWPANVVLDETAADILDAQTGPGRPPSGQQTIGIFDAVPTKAPTPREFKRRGKRQADGWGLKATSVGRDPNDAGGASRFFLNVSPDPVCWLCGAPRHDKMNATREESTCVHASSAANHSTPTTQASDSAESPAPPAQRQPSVDNPGALPLSARRAGAHSRISRETGESIVLCDAPGSPGDPIAQRVKSAGDPCDSCATAIARNLAAMLRGQNPESALGLGSIPSSTASILIRNLVPFVEPWASTGTIPTTGSLCVLFGSVRHAIAESTSLASLGRSTESDPTRFLYQSKASKAERNHGLEGLPEVPAAAMSGNLNGSRRSNGETIAVPMRQNDHPTVKPVELMRWLVRLVTPPGGTVLDPFTGSGTTAIAAGLEGFAFYGCELYPHYAVIAMRRRLGWADR